ncbi:hypothetical protein Tco_0140801 [Tanacetum coccineum]
MHVQETIVEKDENIVKEKEDDDLATDSIIRSLGNVTFEELYGNVKESPYDTESKIKFVKRFNLQHNDDEDQIKFMGFIYSDKEDDTHVKPQEVYDDGIKITLNDSSKDADFQKADSGLESMHGDEIESVSGFEVAKIKDDDTQSQHKEELSKSDEMAVDDVLDELADMTNAQNAKINAFAKKPSLSDPLGHLQLSSAGVQCSKQRRVQQQLDKSDVNLCELVNLIRDLVLLIDTILDSSKATPEGDNMYNQENKDSDITDPASVQGEPQPINTTTEPATAKEAKANAQEEHSSEQAPSILTALVVQPSEEEPLVKKVKFTMLNFVPDFTILLQTPLKSVMPQGIRPPIIINNISYEQYTTTLFSSSSSDFSSILP